MVVTKDNPHSYNRKECREWGFFMSMGTRSAPLERGVAPYKEEEPITLLRLFY